MSVVCSSRDNDPHNFCFECLGDELATLEGDCEHCNTLLIKVVRNAACFKDKRAATPSLRLWGSRVDLTKVREMGPPISLMLSPDREALAPTSSERAGDTSSLASAEMEIESATSEHSSHMDKAYEELLETRTD